MSCTAVCQAFIHWATQQLWIQYANSSIWPNSTHITCHCVHNICWSHGCRAPAHFVNLMTCVVFGVYFSVHKLSVINMSVLSDVFSDRNEKSTEIVYDVFLPDANFRKSSPGKPAVCLCIARSVTRSRRLQFICIFNWSSAHLGI